MHDTRRFLRTALVITGLFILSVCLNGCAAKQAARPEATTVPPTSKPVFTPTIRPASALPPTASLPAPLPTLSIDDTSVKEYLVNDFDQAHSPVEGDPNKYLIFGNLPVSKPAADLSPLLVKFLGRWEGFVDAPPVKHDRKLVLVITEINTREGKAIGWSGTNLQYPDRIGEIRFRVILGNPPSINFQVPWPNGVQEIDTFRYDPETGLLHGQAELANDAGKATFELSRDRSFYVYKDYPKYLSGLGITAQSYQDPELARYGQGYLVYLPEGYEEQPEKTWPLILFLHGYGDRGDNLYLVAKASPFMYIREKGPLPFIIVAPVLSSNEGYSSFPDAYLDGVLKEIQANYRVDPKRLYLTGLSMGGEAAYRLAVNHPETFAALVPLSSYVDSNTYANLDRLKRMPVWVIQGDGDTVYPLAKAQQPVEAIQAAGGNVRFTILANHDHDTWTDTYSDPAFYDWLLQQARP